MWVLTFNWQPFIPQMGQPPISSFSDFCHGTSLHGWPHIPGGSILEKIFWVATIIATAVVAVFLCSRYHTKGTKIKQDLDIGQVRARVKTKPQWHHFAKSFKKLKSGTFSWKHAFYWALRCIVSNWPISFPSFIGSRFSFLDNFLKEQLASRLKTVFISGIEFQESWLKTHWLRWD